MTAKQEVGRPPAVVAASMLALGFGSSLGFLPGYFVAALRDDLGVSRAQVGLLVSLHFGCTGLGSIIGARITEKIGTRLAVVADQVIVAVAAWAAALLGSYAALVGAAVFAGFGYALANASTNEAVAAAVPETRRTLALSAKTSGVPMIALISATLVPWAADRWSWNLILMIAGTAAGASALISSAVIPDIRASQRGTQPGASVLPKGFWWFAVSACFLVGAGQPLFSWTVPYFDEGLGTSKPTAGAIAGAAAGLGAVCMSLTALRADRLGRTRRVPLVVGLCSMLAASLLVVMSGLTLGVAVDWLDTYTWAWLAMALCSGIAAICFTRASRVGPPNR